LHAINFGPELGSNEILRSVLYVKKSVAGKAVYQARDCRIHTM